MGKEFATPISSSEGTLETNIFHAIDENFREYNTLGIWEGDTDDFVEVDNNKLKCQTPASNVTLNSFNAYKYGYYVFRVNFQSNGVLMGLLNGSTWILMGWESTTNKLFCSGSGGWGFFSKTFDDPPISSASYYTFEIVWTPVFLKFLIDGREFYTFHGSIDQALPLYLKVESGKYAFWDYIHAFSGVNPQNYIFRDMPQSKPYNWLGVHDDFSVTTSEASKFFEPIAEHILLENYGANDILFQFNVNTEDYKRLRAGDVKVYNAFVNKLYYKTASGTSTLYVEWLGK